MLVLVRQYGQTSNNFFQHVFIDAFCKENNIKFYNKYIVKYEKDYPGLRSPRKNFFLNLIISISLLLNKFRIINVLTFNTFEDINKYQDLIIKNKRFQLCKGWFFFQPELLNKYRAYYQELFTPAIDQTFYANKYLGKNEPEMKFIGVHIRRGDYKYWHDGKYYYSDKEYIKIIKQLTSIINNECRIIIFTNDSNINVGLYKEMFNNIMFSNESVVVDHYLMSNCDYIIGPLSSFSMWASYIGNKPYYHITNLNKIISLDDFRICCSLSQNKIDYEL